MSIYPEMSQTKYERWYYSIISNAKCQPRSKGVGVYYESHHIHPTALGGPNTKENLVLLTAREHFICHWLLYKFCKGNAKYKMAHAWWRMCNTKNEKRPRYIPHSKTYENAKKAHSEAISFCLAGVPRSEEVKLKISKSNKGKPKSAEHRNKLSETRKGMKLSETHRKNIGLAQKDKPRSEEVKLKISRTKTGVKHTDEHKKKNSDAKRGENNPQFTDYFVTPWGKFSSAVEASNCAPYKCSPPLIRRWCKENNCKVFRLPKFPEWAEKTPAQIGFSFDSKKGHPQ